MASPADSSGRNTPRTCLIRIAPALAPALFLIVATSAAETVRSAVTTTRSEAPSTYHAMPRTPDCLTAWRAAESWPPLNGRVAAGASADMIHTQIAARAMATASNWAALVAGRRAESGFITTGPPLLSCGFRKGLQTLRDRARWLSQSAQTSDLCAGFGLDNRPQQRCLASAVASRGPPFVAGGGVTTKNRNCQRARRSAIRS